MGIAKKDVPLVFGILGIVLMGLSLESLLIWFLSMGGVTIANLPINNLLYPNAQSMGIVFGVLCFIGLLISVHVLNHSPLRFAFLAPIVLALLMVLNVAIIESRGNFWIIGVSIPFAAILLVLFDITLRRNFSQVAKHLYKI